jgi:hypothetical protein
MPRWQAPGGRAGSSRDDLVAVSGMSGGRPAVSYRSVVPLDTLCDTYGLADEVIGDPAGAAESGTPA